MGIVDVSEEVKLVDTILVPRIGGVILRGSDERVGRAGEDVDKDKDTVRTGRGGRTPCDLIIRRIDGFVQR